LKIEGIMKHIINYLSALIAVVLIGTAFAGCADDDAQSANVGLGIKTFFPTKVVTNQPMTINGSGFDAVTEIEFPGGVKTTSFELVGNDMIRVNAPAGIASEGGNIIVRTSTEQAESRIPLTIGNTNVTGFDKQPGDEITGGDQITIYGSDLEFINSIELLDAEGNPQLIDHKDFYRKGTSNLIFRVPAKNIFEGTWVGTVHTYDGKSFSMPELAYTPAKDEGHWETVKTSFWKNADPDGVGAVSWNGTYRFGLDGTDGNNECIATFPEDVWNVIKTGTFRMKFKPAGDSYQIRVTTGWWSTQWLGADNDIAPWNMADRIIDNGDGTYYIEINFDGDPIVDVLDAQHLLFTGNGYTPLEIYTEEEIWVDGPGDQEVKVPVWTNDDPDGHGAISWNGTYRFGLDGTDGNNECIATFSEEVWNRIKTETFYMRFKPAGDSYQVRVTTGWWSTQWLGADNDIAPWNMADRIIDNGDGTYYIEINFNGDPIVDVLDAQHLLFTGNGYTPLEIYFIDIVKGGGAKEVTFWQGDGSAGEISWNGTYRFGLDGNDGNNECIATFPEDIWNIIKTGTFYMQFKPSGDSYQIRVTTGWWSTQWLGADNDIAPWNMADRIIDNGDGTYYIEINFDGDPIVDVLDAQHLLFTGNGYTPLKLYYKE
jgi:hypothetical protein